MNLFDVNWIAVILAALAGFVVGGLWYGPLFGKKWMEAVGLTEDDVKNVNMPVIYGATFLFSLLIAWTMAHVFATYLVEGGDLDVMTKILTAFGVALGFVVPVIAINYLFSQKSRGLFYIDAGYWLVFFTVIGAILAYMPY